jgi:anti-sigma B factor antagonist
MEVGEKKQDGICILTLKGRLDTNTADEFRAKILQIIEDDTCNIVLDCEGLDYISSAGLRVVLEATKKIKQSQGKIVLCSLKPYIQEVFEVSKFDAFLPLTPGLDAALKEF